jgi:hypothetical protein
MRSDVAVLVYSLPTDLRAIVLGDIKGKTPDDQKAFIDSAWGWALGPLDGAAYRADQEAQRAAVQAGRNGGVTTAKKRRMGIIPAADPAGAKWKPDYRSALNAAVFPAWGKIPVYVPALVPYMSATVRGTIIVIGDIVDHLGDFELPRAQHAKAVGCAERKAYAALETLRDAGLIKVKHHGNRTQATVWSYVPVAEFDTVKARKLLQARRRQAADRAEKLGE